jgi:RNase P/RNase MRP subunit POP5
MSRHRYCTTSDRDGFIEELAEELWEERHAATGETSWADANPELQREYRKLAAETLRILEHGHG